jgi:hypothetical protein
VENNKKWKEFTNLKPGTYMAYKSRQYSEKDEQKLMKAIIRAPLGARAYP